MHPEPLFETASIESQLTKTEIGLRIQKHQEQIKRMKSLRREKQDWSAVPQSAHSKNTVNPIRRICDQMAVQPNPAKSLIKLHLGDPTITGDLPPCDVAVQAMIETLVTHKYDGYAQAVGDVKAREAVAQHFTVPEAPLVADDIILASGASHALQMAIEALADPGDNILVPHPGFPLYATLSGAHGIEDRGYRLDMKNGGLIDLAHLESQIDDRTRAIVVNNPGNPTGVVLPKWHLEQVLALAYRYRVPIIADEIYGDLVYDGAEFHYMATLSPKVPIISCDGLAKRWLVPGWRLGWCAIHDRYGALSEVRKGMVALSQKIVGPCSLLQGALPKILRDTPQSFFENIRQVVAANAKICYEQLKNVPGLHPVRTQGALYMMVGIDKASYGDETPFVQGLITDQSVFCLPGSAFFAPNWMRLVLTYPEEVTLEACQRIREFCAARYQPPLSNGCAPAKRSTASKGAFLDEETVSSSDEGIDNANTDSE